MFQTVIYVCIYFLQETRVDLPPWKNPFQAGMPEQGMHGCKRIPWNLETRSASSVRIPWISMGNYKKIKYYTCHFLCFFLQRSKENFQFFANKENAKKFNLTAYCPLGTLHSGADFGCSSGVRTVRTAHPMSLATLLQVMLQLRKENIAVFYTH